MDLLDSILDSMERPPQTLTKQEILLKSLSISISLLTFTKAYLLFFLLNRTAGKSEKTF